MKKLLSIAAVTVALVSLSSCKKDYTCTCKYTMEGLGEQTQTLALTNLKKKDAETSCDTFKAQWSTFGGTCELK
jgi:hypothetical protein